MVNSQGSSFVFQNDQISRVPPWVQNWSNPTVPHLGSEVFKSQGPPLGSKMVQCQGSSLVFQNDLISRVPLWVQKWSNPKGPPLGSEMFKSQGSPLGFKNGQIPRVFFCVPK